MADLSKIPIRYFDPDEIYHHKIDNRPLQDLADQIAAVNNDVDQLLSDFESAKGNTSDLAHFLAVAHNPDGSLKPNAVNNINSSSYNSEKTNIEDHKDSANYVRMTMAERTKLDNISEGATRFSLIIGSDKLSGDILLTDSSTILVSHVGNTVSLKTNFSASSLHIHYYGQTPVGAIDGSNIIFTTPAAIAYLPGTLRVYWKKLRETRIIELDPNNGTFKFDGIIPQSGDQIVIDFDVSA